VAPQPAPSNKTISAQLCTLLVASITACQLHYSSIMPHPIACMTPRTTHGMPSLYVTSQLQRHAISGRYMMRCYCNPSTPMHATCSWTWLTPMYCIINIRLHAQSLNEHAARHDHQLLACHHKLPTCAGTCWFHIPSCAGSLYLVLGASNSCIGNVTGNDFQLNYEWIHLIMLLKGMPHIQAYLWHTYCW
jgi:hypothetical protein